VCALGFCSEKIAITASAYIFVIVWSATFFHFLL
jgi:hypothetical protein